MRRVSHFGGPAEMGSGRYETTGLDAPAISVVVVSRDRPAALRRCLTALAQLDYGPFEIVIVADAAGQAAIADLPAAAGARQRRRDAPGISAARNAGVAAAGGEIVAFIDDDAVPEPTWLTELAAAFADPETAAAVGYVRGRNGISYQSRADAIDAFGRTRSADLPGRDPRTPVCPADHVPKLVGTNMAVRRAVLAGLGGFDEVFGFYLDDSDLSMRLAAAGLRVVAVPGAEVHHSFAASPRRAACRRPKTLFDIGRSLAAFLRKHAPPGRIDAARREARAAERSRLLRHMVGGTAEPVDIAPLLASFDAGFEAGLSADLDRFADLSSTSPAFAPFPDHLRSSGHALLWGGGLDARRLRAEAAGRAARGERVSLFLFHPTTLYHRVRFRPEGYWEQSGGLFGRAMREQPLIQAASRRARLAQECHRVAPQRGFALNDLLGASPT